MLLNNLNILNQQQQRQPLNPLDNKGDHSVKDSTKKQAKKLNVVELNVQNNHLPQLPSSQLKSAQLQEHYLNPFQMRRQSEIQQQYQQRVRTANVHEKENMQSYLQDAYPRSRTPFNNRENYEKPYERDVCSSLSKTREPIQMTTKMIELNVTQLNDRIEGRHRQFRRQSLDQHYINNQNDKKERNKYNNYLGQLQVSSSSFTSSSQQNKFQQQNDERIPTKHSQVEIAQMMFQNSFLNVKQILKNQSTQNTNQDNRTNSTQENEDIPLQNQQKQTSSKNSSLASLVNSVPLNCIVKGELDLIPPSNKYSTQKYRGTYITSLVSPISDDCQSALQSFQEPQKVLLSSQNENNQTSYLKDKNDKLNKKAMKMQEDSIIKSKNNSENTKQFTRKSMELQSNFQEILSDLKNNENNCKLINIEKSTYSNRNKLIQIDINTSTSQTTSNSKGLQTKQHKIQEENDCDKKEIIKQNPLNSIQQNSSHQLNKLNESQQSLYRIPSENERMARVFNNQEIQFRIKKLRGLDDSQNENQSAYYNINTSTDDYINTKEDEDIIFQNLSLFENQILNNDKIEINIEGLSKQHPDPQQFGIETFRKEKILTARGGGNSNIVNVNLIPNPHFPSKGKSKSIQPNNVLRGKKLTLKQILEKNQKLKKQTPFHLLKNEMQAHNATMNSQNIQIFAQRNGLILQDHNMTLRSEFDNNDLLSVQRIDLQSADSSIQPSQRYYSGSQYKGKLLTKTTIDDDNSMYARNAYANHTNEMIKTNASMYASQLMNKTKEDDCNNNSIPKILIQEESQQIENQEAKKTSREKIKKLPLTSQQDYQPNTSQSILYKRRRKSAIVYTSNKSDSSQNNLNDDPNFQSNEDPKRETSLNFGSLKQVVNLNQLQLRNFDEETPINKKTGRKTILSILNCKDLLQTKGIENQYILEQDQQQEQNSPERSLDVVYMNQLLHSKKYIQKLKNEVTPVQSYNNKLKNSQNTSINNQKRAVSISVYHISGNSNNDASTTLYPTHKQGVGEKKYQPISFLSQSQQTHNILLKQQQSQFQSNQLFLDFTKNNDIKQLHLK